MGHDILEVPAANMLARNGNWDLLGIAHALRGNKKAPVF
jgi:hypothetical protein